MGKINTQRILSTVFILMLLVGLLGSNVAAQQDKVDLNFQSVELRDAFRALADVANMNVVTDSSVKGTTSVHLEDISFREAVDLLAKSSGLDYRIVNNTVLVATPEKLTQGFGKKVTKSFKLKNSDPEELKKSLNLLLDDASIRVDKRTSRILVSAYQSEIPEIERTIKELDEEKKQVIIQAKIAEISKSGLKEMGINWDFGQMNFQADNDDSSGDSSNGDGEDSSSDSGDDSSSGGNLLEIGEVSLQYQSMLNMLERDGNSNILANPRLTTVDGKQANIEIGESVPIIKPGGDQQTEVTFKDIGIMLDIEPRITEDDQVFINVKPEVSVVSEYFETADGARYPIVETRNAETNVRIQSGGTIAIGGLIREEEFENMRKIPFLGDIPVLGNLFKNKSKDTQKTELIIFLTPKIVETSEAEQIGQSDEDSKTTTFEYEMKPNDNIWNVASLFDVSFVEILDKNNIEYITDVKPGKVLQIPVNPENYYEVKSNDKLSKVAKKFDVAVEDIRKINNLDTLDNKQGQKIYVPAQGN